MPFSTSAKLADVAPDGFPFISTRTLASPRNETLPLISTDTRGTFSNISVALPPAAVTSFSALYTILSIRFSINGADPVTTTSFKVFAPGETKICPRFLSGFASVVVIGSIIFVG